MERLQKYISRCGYCSRRAAENLIEQGQVTVNGKLAAIGCLVEPESDEVQVQGTLLSLPEKEKTYIALNKPQKVLSSRKDDRGRLTVVQFIDTADTYVYPVGRLDFESSGLILLTNDGELAQRLLHPSHKVAKTYRVLVSRKLTAGELTRFREGIPIDGKPTAPTAEIEESSLWEDCAKPSKGANCQRVQAMPEQRISVTQGFWYSIVLREGRKRQIRLMIKALGAKVIELIRVRFGPVELKGIPRGWYRRLTCDEVEKLKGLNRNNGRKSSETGRDKHEKGHKKEPKRLSQSDRHKKRGTRKRRSSDSRHQ